jgi:spoIIIJ-associated protein
MKSIEVEGNSVDDAVEAALKELDAEREQVNIEILESGSKGFLGLLGNKQARVRVEIKADEPGQIAEFINELVSAIGVDVSYEVLQQEPYWNVNFYGPDVRLLIGRRGETLNALQMIINLVAGKRLNRRIKLVVDAEGYRERREETLQRLACRIADKVKHYKKDIALEPMTPQERRIIHLTLQDDQSVFTVSEGDDPYRRVVVCLKK